MAQPTPAQQQREPSMEEILASIRRIIEDGDATAGSDAVVGGNDDKPSPAVASAEEAPAPVEVAAFRAELGSSDRTPIPPARASLADIHQSVRAPQPEVSPDTDASASLTSRLRPAKREEKPVSSIGVAPSAANEPASSPKPSAEAGKLRVVAEAPAAHPAPASIISDRAERKVAASFGELSDAFAASRRRSFDEIAEEMMRPMLQEWMDNNLPVLVERLVREEIERIARGGAR